MSSNPSSIWQRARSFFSGVARVIEFLRRAVLNLAALAFVVALLTAVVLSQPESLKDKTVLVLAIKGPLKEQKAGGARESALAQLQGQDEMQTRLRDVLAVLDAAAADPKISRVLLRLDDFSGAGLSSLREVGAALERFKASGKPVTAWGLSYDQRQYYLAAHASEVFLHPMGMVMMEGLGRQRAYYKDALDKLGVSANVLRVGKYKNAGEPFFANKPSPESIESEKHVMDALWRAYTQAVEKARRLPEGSINQTIDALPGALVAAGGSAARLAQDSRWIDGVKTLDEVRTQLMESGERDAKGHTFRQIAWQDYLQRLPSPSHGDGVAIIVAEGEIIDGKASPGRVGGDSSSALIRRAREDDSVKALVLRVNSPGGSALASELVRRELELTRQAGKPVVVSMGDVAASGGYWISMASDEVIAEPNTITGSIGVFGMLPTAEGLMNKIGIGTGGYRTTWLAGAYDLKTSLDPRFAKLVQASIENIYSDFTAKAAAARKTTPQKIDAVAQGRIWTGQQALGHGLVDRTGTLADAIAAAKTRAALPAETPVRYLESEGGPLQRLLSLLEGRAMAGLMLKLTGDGAVPVLPALTEDLHAQLQSDALWLSDLLKGRQPYAAVVHCLCRIAP